VRDLGPGGCSAFGKAGRLVLIDCREREIPARCRCRSRRGSGVQHGEEARAAGFAVCDAAGECEAALAVLQKFYPQAKCLADLSVKQVEEKLRNLSVAQAQRALHVTKEIERVQRTTLALERGDLGGSGAAAGGVAREFAEFV